jgi:amino acid adenylation domain-containing protein
VQAGDRQIRYAELDARANRLARQLRAHGIAAESVVALAMDRSIEMVVGMLGVLKAGAAWLPLDIGHPADRLAHILEDAGAALVLTREADALATLGSCEQWTLDGRLDQGAAEADGERRVDANALAYVIYTSGSTGQPKGVEVPHRALSNVVDWHANTLAIESGDRCSQLAGAAFDASLLEWWGALASGASVHIVDDATRSSPPALIGWLVEQAITVAFMPTPLAEVAMRERWPAQTALRALFVGGDVLRHAPSEALPFRVYNDYGPTEAAIVSTCELVAAAGADAASPGIGRPLPGMRVYVLDAARQPVPVGVVGELYLAGVGLARGYRGQPAMSAERFLADPFASDADARMYRSGDRARYRADGTLEFVGRHDDQVKIRGYRIELGEIQAALLAIDGVQQAHVLVREDVPGDRRIAAYLVPAQDVEEMLSLETITAALRRRLPDYMLPASIVFLDVLPLNSSGKVDASALARPEVERYLDPTEVIPASNPIEATLISIWEQLLDYRPAGINHNFFRHGGHSLNALSLRSRIQDDFAVDIDLQVLFENGTIEHLAGEIARLREQQASDFPNARISNPRASSPNPTNAWKRLLGRLVSGMRLGRRRSMRLLSADPVAAEQHLVAIEAAASGLPVFCVHPIGGGVTCYAELASILGTEQPVYGLKSAASTASATATIEQMASRYIQAIRCVQAQGPYSLCGWSLGGVIAFEMARQLRADGEDVDMLCMLDSYPFDPAREVRRLDRAQALDGFVTDIARSAGVELSVEWLASVDLGVDDDPEIQALTALKSKSVLPAEFGIEDFRERLDTYFANYQAWARFEPQTHGGHTHLTASLDSIENSAKNPSQSWGRVATGGFAINVVPGDHYTILRGQNVRQVAAHISAQRTATRAELDALKRRAQSQMTPEDALN